MRTLLVFPPQAHFTQPYLALPSLKAFLIQNGFGDTHQWDLNLESLEHLLSPARLSVSRDRVRSRLAEFRGDEALRLQELDRFRTLAEADLAADAVVAGIDDAVATLRDEARFHDYDQYIKATKRLDRAFKLISAEWYPTSLSANSLSMRHSIEREAEVLAAIFDEEENLYLSYYREHVVPKILEMAPALLGISITYGSQVIPGLTLARLIKEARPEIHITIGGGLLAYAGEKIAKSGRVFDVLDSIVMLEGEGPLLGVAKAVRDGTSLDAVGNLIHRTNGKVVRNPPAEPLEIDSLPTPDFEGLPMDRYFSPKIALPLAITRGCYYEKCVFCTLYKVIGPGYRQRNIEKILDDIETVTARWGSDVIYFVVEDMPPVLFRKLPEALKSRDIQIRWWTDARLERNLYSKELCAALYESGCRRIALGFESASQRVLDLMDKGTAIEESSSIVKNISESGIAVVLYTMIGFPTETEEEARMTLQWIRDHQPWIQEVSLRIFYIDILSTVYAKPEGFRITKIHEDETKDYQVYYDHDCEVGLDRAAARQIFFDFMDAVRAEFPLFQGDNLWLFELKSHHFLYLCKEGSLDVFHGKSQATIARWAPLEDDALDLTRPRLTDGVEVRELPYDLTEVARVLLDAEDQTLRPRYQSGAFKADMFDQLESVIAPVEPNRSAVVYRGETSDFLRLGKDAVAILRRCDGERTAGQILDGYSERQRPAVRKFLRALFEKGLIEVVGGQPAPSRTSREGVLA